VSDTNRPTVIFYATEPDTSATKRAMELGADAVWQTKNFHPAQVEATFRELGLI